MLSEMKTHKIDGDIETSTSRVFLDDIANVLHTKQILTSKRQTQSYSTGIKIGGGDVKAVFLPESLIQIWQILKICVAHNKIIIMQAANTGVTAGSTPYGNDYDREIVIISTLKISKIILLNQGTQVLAFAGATPVSYTHLTLPTIYSV